MLKELCLCNGGSGDEKAVSDLIKSQLKNTNCKIETDALGSLIVFKKGKMKPKHSVSISAHMDEVAFIISSVRDDGYLNFKPVGGIDPHVVIDRTIVVNGINGVIGAKAVHQLTAEEKKTQPGFENLYIDIGAKSKEEALKYISLGDYAYFNSAYTEFGSDCIMTKALDDRIGCYLMIELIKSDLPFDTTFCFNVQEEVGLRGAMCSAYAVQSDISFVLETTTASDLQGCTGGERVCVLGDGVVISFMDGRTVYDKELYRLAFELANKNNIKCQTKTMIAGGNDAGAIQSAGKGSRVLALSVPCRYIHSGASVVSKKDIQATKNLIWELLQETYD